MYHVRYYGFLGSETEVSGHCIFVTYSWGPGKEPAEEAAVGASLIVRFLIRLSIYLKMSFSWFPQLTPLCYPSP